MARKLGPISITLITAGMLALVSGTYAAGDHFGFRPALIQDVRNLAVEVSANTTRSLIIQIDNYERIMQRRRLTRDECRRYRRAARALGVPAKRC